MKDLMISAYSYFRVPFIFLSHPLVLFLVFLAGVFTKGTDLDMLHNMIYGTADWIWQYNDRAIRTSGPFYTLTVVLIICTPMIVFHTFEKITGIRKYFRSLSQKAAIN